MSFFFKYPRGGRHHGHHGAFVLRGLAEDRRDQEKAYIMAIMADLFLIGLA